MSYFGEEYDAENCGECDNCSHPKERMEAKDNVVKALKAIKALDERFAIRLYCKCDRWKTYAADEDVPS